MTRRTTTNALKELKAKTSRIKSAKTTTKKINIATNKMTKPQKTSVTTTNKNTASVTNLQSELKNANERITVLENKLQSFINVVYREMNNELSEGPKSLSKKISKANLLNE